jgi:GNAT superfamily N-acetyltransferase
MEAAADMEAGPENSRITLAGRGCDRFRPREGPKSITPAGGHDRRVNGREAILEDSSAKEASVPASQLRVESGETAIPSGSRSARHCIDVARDDSIGFRRATVADAEPLARGVIEGVEDYPSFAPPGWIAPAFESELKHLREALANPDVCCLIAESEGALVGQITVLPARRAPHPVEDSSLAHISNLFVRRDHWGVGLAGELHRAAVEAAGARGFTELRLFVAAGQARARRFYEREGWLAASEPFDDPIPGLTMIEYRYKLRDR